MTSEHSGHQRRWSRSYVLIYLSSCWRLVSIIANNLSREDVQCPDLDLHQPPGLLSPLLSPGDSPGDHLEDGLLPGQMSGRGQWAAPGLSPDLQPSHRGSQTIFLWLDSKEFITRHGHWSQSLTTRLTVIESIELETGNTESNSLHVNTRRKTKGKSNIFQKQMYLRQSYFFLTVNNNFELHTFLFHSERNEYRLKLHISPVVVVGVPVWDVHLGDLTETSPEHREDVLLLLPRLDGLVPRDVAGGDRAPVSSCQYISTESLWWSDWRDGPEN